jgi:hypothetical protein
MVLSLKLELHRYAFRCNASPFGILVITPTIEMGGKREERKKIRSL